MNYLKNHNLVAADELVVIVNASPVVVRRDLIKLGEQDVIGHTYGGVILNRFIPIQSTTHKKMWRSLVEKHAIASATVSIVKAGDSVVLNVSVIMIELARQTIYLPLRVITSNLYTTLFLVGFK